MKTNKEFDYEGFNKRLTAYHAKGQFLAAYRWLRGLADLRNNDAEILFPLSRICIIINKPEEAYKWAEMAWKSGEKTAWNLRYYMEAVVGVGKYRQAIDVFDAFVSKNDDINAPGLNDARLDKAFAYAGLEMHKDAIRTAQEHIAGRRKGSFSFYSLKEANTLIRDSEIAIREEEMYGKTQKSGDNEGRMTPSVGKRIERKVNELYAADDFGTLYKFLKPIVKKYPNEYFFKIHLSYACVELDLFDEALVAAKAAYSIEPSDPLSLSQLIEALYCHQDYEEAVERARELQRRGEFDIAYCRHGEGIMWARELLAQATFYCAASLLRLGRIEEARKEIAIHENYRNHGVKMTITREAFLNVKGELNV